MIVESLEHYAIDADMLQTALDRFDKVTAPGNADAPPVIAVVGAFSRGKSALINALIGQPFLPVHPLPTTALPTRLVYADMVTASIIYPDREVPIAIDVLSTLTLSQSASSLIEDATAIQIGCPSPLLASGIVILDTPGIDAPGSSLFSLADDVAALLVVFDADPPLGAEELAFFAEITRQIPLIIWVQTKIDLLTEADLQKATAFNQSALDEYGSELTETSTAIQSVSARTGAGLDGLRAMLLQTTPANLKYMRQEWQLKLARDRAKPILDGLIAEKQRLNAIREQLTAAETLYERDLEDIRAGTLATLAHLSDYVLGNLSEAMYRVDPAVLSGPRGVVMADDQLRQVRDQLHNEVERALLAVRQAVLESLTGPVQPADTFPVVPQWTLPDPPRQTVTIRITERRRLQPSQIDADQTVKAYRMAVTHMSDQYAAVLTPPLESVLDIWQAQVAGWFTDQRTALSADHQKIAEWVDKLRAWF
jgi:GTPase Era involved in 16S rRNA processing